MPSPGSPLAKRMADLSLLLCPCCGFGLRPLDGTHLALSFFSSYLVTLRTTPVNMADAVLKDTSSFLKRHRWCRAQ